MRQSVRWNTTRDVINHYAESQTGQHKETTCPQRASGITAFAEATIDGPVEERYSQRSINGLGGQWRPHGSFHTT